MTRPARTILILGAVAVVAVVALATIAQRYESLAPTKSVSDVDVPAPAPMAVESAPTAPAAAEPQPAPSGTPDRARPSPLEAEFAVFADGREAIRGVLEKHPAAASSLRTEIEGKTADRDRVPMYNTVLMNMRLERYRQIEPAGMSEARYREIRDAFRAWRRGDETVDPGLRAAFEARPDLVEKADLGEFEVLDD